MKENLKSLFENAVLSDETKVVIEEAFNVAVQAKQTELETEYQAKLVEAKAELKEEAVKMIEEAISAELESIAEEIEHARTLEVQYAEKLTQFKESYAQAQEETVKILIAEAVAEELDELKEDIEVAKKYEFAAQLVESFGETYQKLFGSEDDITVYDQLQEAKAELDALKREKKINEILESVTGEKKEVVRTILESVSTDKLEAKFESIRPIILAESKKEEKEEVLEEGVKEEEVKGKVVLDIEESEDDENELTPAQRRLIESVRYGIGRK